MANNGSSQGPTGKSSSNFKQQRMRAWQPTPTACSTIVTFSLIGVIFIILGSVLLAMSQSIVEVSKRYDDSCTTNEPGEVPVPCDFTLKVDDEMEAPVFLYYKLNNFYQNHRRYVKSRDYEQLAGENKSADDIESNCEPIVSNKDLGFAQSWGGDDLVPSAAANPCGLVAKSFMNDTYTSKMDDFIFEDDDIAWESDVENKFSYVDDDKTKSGELQWVDPTNVHFIVWMRTAGLPNFRKLYAKIDKTIPADTDFEIEIIDNYPVGDFDGEKHLILSTTNAFGGRNDFLGIAYIVVGVISLVFAGFFGIKYSRSRKNN